MGVGKRCGKETGSFLFCQLSQASWEFLVDTAESAVGKNCDHVAASQFGCNRLDDGIGIGQEAYGTPDLLNFRRQRGKFEAFVLRHSFRAEDVRDDNFVGSGETVGQVALQDAAPKRVGTWLEDRPEAR